MYTTEHRGVGLESGFLEAERLEIEGFVAGCRDEGSELEYFDVEDLEPGGSEYEIDYQ